MPKQFMTVQVKGRMVTGLTDDGRFVRHLWRGPLPAVGALVGVPAPSHSFRYWAMAATAALLILVLQLPFLTPFARAGTVVTIDINPSFELMLTPSGRVTNVRALNADAEPIIAAIADLPPALPDALATILGATATAGKLKADADNLVLIGVAPGWRGMPAGIDLSALERSVADGLDSLNVDGLVRVVGVRPSDLAKARLNRLSVNRYLLVRELKAKGQDVTFTEARGKSAGQLLKDHGLKPDEVIPGQRGGPHKPDKDGKTPSGNGKGNIDNGADGKGNDGKGNGGKGPGKSPGH